MQESLVSRSSSSVTELEVDVHQISDEEHLGYDWMEMVTLTLTLLLLCRDMAVIYILLSAIPGGLWGYTHCGSTSWWPCRRTERQGENRHMLYGCGVAALDPLSSEFRSNQKKQGGLTHLVPNHVLRYYFLSVHLSCVGQELRSWKWPSRPCWWTGWSWG